MKAFENSKECELVRPPGNGADEEDGGEATPSGQLYVWATETARKLRHTRNMGQGE